MQYDKFQTEAIQYIDEGHTVIVSAPTGAGKTVIAEYAIEKALMQGKQAIYTAPIKALSNQKYRDFHGRYEDKIGILTGDVSINPQAPILIMTTEIYRNTLFEDPERLRNVDWVIFDEVHYLDDFERGTVWEESIMFSPPSIKLLCLSATVPNIDELAQWISEVHRRSVKVIIEEHRPVPLHHAFQCQGRIIETKNDLRKFGYLNQDDWRQSFRKRRHKRQYYRPLKAKHNRLDSLVSFLQDNKRLPCIYFVFGRKRAQLLAEEISRFDFLFDDNRDRISERYWKLCEKYNLTEEKSALEQYDLVRNGIAYHHAGMLPTLKEVIEQLFTEKAIQLIFTTETFALGINMPARTVVFDELRKFYGTHFGNLRTRDYYQMAGRAGRRGMDECGFVYARINPTYISYPEVLQVIYGKPEAVHSQFNTTYATVLNLYKQLKKDLIKIYPSSFHFFQSSKKRREFGYETLERKLSLLHDMHYIQKDSLTEKGEFALSLYGYELALSEMFADGILQSLSERELAMVLIGLIFEPRKGQHTPFYQKHVKRLIRLTESFIRHIHRKEHKFGIKPYSKSCHFNFAPALEAWMMGGEFSDIQEIVEADEGELVRYFRMVIQLLRQLRSAHGVSEEFREKTNNAIEHINRDIIDAERQLRA